MKTDLGHWVYDKDFNVEDWVGFVYRITDTQTGREYIGKKNFFSRRSKRVKGRVNKTWKTIESNWKKYTSSSATINQLIEESGKERFIFSIESLHASKASLTYAEVERMILEDVLRATLVDGSRKYYNGVIPPIKFIPPLDSDDELRNKKHEYFVNKTPNQRY